jgi:nucleoside-diphosphate-sugar epimerase/aryl carrier-like protein
MTVPSIVGDLMTQDGAFERLATLEFLAVGGGAMSPDQGLRLKEQNVNLLNHYGVTEIGAIAPIFRPGPDYNWRYLRLRSDLGLELHSIPSSSHFKLVGHPIGWDEKFEVQDELEKNPDTVGDYLEVRILGRTDDVIVLKTGEKIMPQQLERELMASPVIKTAICIGEGQFEVVVLVEPASYPFDEAEFIDQVWDLVSSKNTSLDRHAKVSSKKAIIVKPVEKMIPRTDKGSVSRRQVRDVFSDEIQAAYAAIEIDLPVQNLDWDNIEGSIRALVKGIFEDFESSSDEDFFEAGMDSLQAVRLARQLNVSLQSETLQAASNWRWQSGSELSAESVYKHPTISALAEFVKAQRNNANGEIETSTSEEDNTARVKALSERFIANLYGEEEVGYCKTTKRVVLLTGATGNLGSHMLSQLVQSPSVSKVICLYRQTKDDTPLSRIRLSVSASGLSLDERCWAKVELVEAAEFIRSIGLVQNPVERHPSDGVSNGNDVVNLFTRLAQDVTHIIHLAWPIDFQRTLESFIPHIEMVEALINLARAARTSGRARKQPPARLLFASSIAVVRNYGKEFSASSSSIVVPEEEMQTPETVVPMGYAEAKWVCERMLGHVGRYFPDDIEPVIVRIGQLSGPEASPGIWKTSEHIPALLKACSLIEAMPQLEGVT